jgi:hypothetical protein
MVIQVCFATGCFEQALLPEKKKQGMSVVVAC